MFRRLAREVAGWRRRGPRHTPRQQRRISWADRQEGWQFRGNVLECLPVALWIEGLFLGETKVQALVVVSVTLAGKAIHKVRTAVVLTLEGRTERRGWYGRRMLALLLNTLRLQERIVTLQVLAKPGGKAGRCSAR